MLYILMLQNKYCVRLVVIIMNLSHIDYENNLTQILKNRKELFKANLLTLNLNKTFYVILDYE
jgi:hypothetical protein